jgi:putative transposase
MTETTPSPLNNVITIDDERIKSHLERVVRGSVEETLNALLEAEADRLCNAQRYERSEARRDTRAGHYERKLQTKAGEVRLKVPKLRAQTFETAIIERYRRRESSVEEALIEMYLAGVSVRRVEDITEALWGTRVALDHVGTEQEDLHNDRSLAQSADRGRAPVCLPRRHRAQAQLGRRGAQRLAAGCDRRE